jgi:hypothetical protein
MLFSHQKVDQKPVGAVYAHFTNTDWLSSALINIEATTLHMPQSIAPDTNELKN